MPNGDQNSGILFASDVPFWLERTGAQYRIADLIRGLNVAPFDVSMIFTGESGSINKCNRFRQWSREIPLHEIHLDQPPQSGGWDRIRWHWDGLMNLLKPSKLQRVINERKPRKLDDFHSPAICRRFVDHVKSVRPQTIVFEYLSQIQLLRSLPNSIRKQTLAVLDSHDVLHRRAESFREQGHSHWIEISKQQEDAAVTEFDLIIAIQSEEAEYFADQVGREKVITTGVELPTSDEKRAQQKGEISVGVLASNNLANVDVVQRILNSWPVLKKQNQSLGLVIAGSVCSGINDADYRRLKNVVFLNQVESVQDFYRLVDIVWNPVRIGSGLKIKNVEAMSFGKLVITTEHGAAGIPVENRDQSMIIGESDEEHFDLLSSITIENVHQMGECARNFQKKHFGTGTQYPELRQKLRSLLTL